ncbi:MAG: translation elongation factor Ts [Deltaproteobacteria bacterium]|jgi:elongation factor Ts|nr:translation elongation factor Ts [Deltaproteobacteria bacterium]
MELTAQLVKTLREKTNAGMMDCKRALQECECDLEKAVDWLRQKGLMTARKRAGRATREGLALTKVSGDGKVGAVVELNSETDFVSKMDSFKDIAESIVAYLVETPQVPANLEALLQCKCPKCGETFGEVVNRAVGTTGENMRLRRFQVVKAGPKGLVHDYVHAGGKIGVLVELDVEKTGSETDDLAHNLAMHVAAANPMFLRNEDISKDFYDKEKAVQEGKAKEEIDERVKKGGKPISPDQLPGMLAKMVEGKLKKSFAELVLLEQAYVKEPKKTIAAVLAEAKANLGEVKLVSFVRFQLGEEIPGEAE